MASVQLVRLVSITTASRRASSGGSSAVRGLPETASSRRNSGLPQDRFSLSHHQSTREGVRIEAFAHNTLGGEAVFVASLSNSVLLIVRIGGRGGEDNDGSDSLRSWVLEWPVQGKIRGLCVSPDLVCVLCVTEDLEGVYILAINNLEAGDGRKGSVVQGESDAARDVPEKADVESAGYARGAPTATASATTAAAAAGGGPSARPPHRAAAASAFPSLLHLASRGQRRKAGGTAPHPAAEPVFIASLARRAGGNGKNGHDDGGWGGGHRRANTPGRASGAGGGRSRHGSRSSAAQLECLWWVTRNGDHVAIIGRPDGEVHFLDLERLQSWVVASPHPAGQRGRVCALTIESATPPAPPAGHPVEEGMQPEQPSEDNAGVASSQAEDPDTRHLVTVLETGAVFVVLLERGRPDGSPVATSEAPDNVAGEGNAGEENDADNPIQGSHEDDEKNTAPKRYECLGADTLDEPEFAPAWLDIGRGSSGGGGGGWGVRVMPGGDMKRPGIGVTGTNRPSRGLQVSIVSRAWGNKCTVKMLGLATQPDGVGGSTPGQARDKNQGRPQALRMETVKQVNLPFDHPAPEQHALAVIKGEWAIFASPPAGGTPARVTVAAIDDSERPAPGSVCLVALPTGERVGGVALLSKCQLAGGASDSGKTTSWGLVWSDSSIYRVDLGEASRPPRVRESDVGVAAPSPSRPPPPPPPLPPPRSKGSPLSSGGMATSRTMHRPSAAAVARACELRSSGELSEAVKVALDALDGNRAPGASGAAASASLGNQEAGGGLTTRMVREDLANSLLEWLLILHTRQSDSMTRRTRVSRTPAAPNSGGTGGNFASSRGAAGVQAGERPERDRRPPAGSPLHLRTSSRKGSKYFTSSRMSRRESGDKGDGSTPREAAQQPVSGAPSRLEQFLLSSLDYDPLRAATLLHAHGQADLAIIAGAARGDAALSGVIRILAESPSPPRLGSRAVQSLCAVSKAGELVRVGDGTLFAALDPALRIRVLISDHRILFQSPESESLGLAWSAPASNGETETGKPFSLANLRGQAQCFISPNLPALSVEELAEVCSRLAQWCNGELLLAGHGDRSTLELSTSHVEARLDFSPSASAQEAMRVLLDAILELSIRDPPPGAVHRRAWLEAGCISGCLRDQGSKMGEVVAPVEVLTGGDGARDGVADASGCSSHWPSVAATLCRILHQRGIFGSKCPSTERDQDGRSMHGGLPTAARRVLLSYLSLLQGWYDPVSVMLKAVGGGCWAAVALQLELSGHRREAASAKLHGVVAVLQGGDSGPPGETMRILSGAEPSSGTPKVHNDFIHGDVRKTSVAQLLQIVDDFVFLGGIAQSPDRSAAHASHALLPQHGADNILSKGNSAVADDSGEEILARASVLAEVVCVWRRFGLPVTSLEATLHPRLCERGSARVLTALFFPQLCMGACRDEAQVMYGELGIRLGVRAGTAVKLQDSMGPTQAQIKCAENLGLSPRFQLALIQVGARIAALESHRSPEIGARASPGGSYQSSVVAAGTTGGSSSTVTPAVPDFSSLHGLPSSALAVLLETRANGGEASSAWVGPSADGTGNKYDGRRGSWSSASGSVGLGRSTTGASGRRGSALVVDENLVIFSCGHSYGRDQLWRLVVPTCVSSLSHATSSLQRTEQMLVREYRRRGNMSVACPDCATKDLRRLVHGLRPNSLASAGGSSHDFQLSKAFSAPAHHPAWAPFPARGRMQQS